MPTTSFRKLVLVVLALCLLFAFGCQGKKTAKNYGDVAAPAPAAEVTTPAVTPDATASDDSASPAPVPDPLYGWNRAWFVFNDVFYSVLMRPLARGYAVVMPKMIRTGLANAYTNFTFPIRFVNALLQLNFTKASREFGRFMLNSTLGIGGLVDVAKSDPNLQPGNEDFGQTLGHYGMGEGFYLVLPLLGPSDLRDGIGLIGDAAANPLTWIFGPWAVYDDYNPWYWSYIIKAGDIFNRLPETLENYDAITKPAIEPYSAVKDAYIQYRRNAVAH